MVRKKIFWGVVLALWAVSGPCSHSASGSTGAKNDNRPEVVTDTPKAQPAVGNQVLPAVSTMAVAAAIEAPMSTPTETAGQAPTLKKLNRGYADFPRGMTSFGATVLNNKIYVTGGKSGRAHRYARSYQNGNIYCLDLAGKDWNIAGQTLGLQGLAIVGYQDKVIRIGGLEARNEEGEEHQLRSIAAVKVFAPESKSWSTLPSLPQGRSSLDACINDGKIYVVGGWSLDIGKEGQWATDMLVLDLKTEAPQWQSIATPFKTRALAARAFDNKIFAIGGITDGSGTTAAVQVFDIEKNHWSAGPKVPCEGDIKAFGCSAVVASQQLLVSTYDGGIYRLDDDQSQWSKIHQLDAGRFFHQLLPAGESSFAIIGGSHMSHGRQLAVEVFSLAK